MHFLLLPSSKISESCLVTTDSYLIILFNHPFFTQLLFQVQTFCNISINIQYRQFIHLFVCVKFACKTTLKHIYNITQYTKHLPQLYYAVYIYVQCDGYVAQLLFTFRVAILKSACRHF